MEGSSRIAARAFFGGYAEYSRTLGHFVVKIPEGLASEDAAPMFCGGVTVYAPLKKGGCGTMATRVGIVGVGSLGKLLSTRLR